jgi:hypothetical protein
MMTFREYINSTKRYVRPSVPQTFIKDARIDENFPDIESWDELEAYLKAGNAGPDDYARLLNGIPREVLDYVISQLYRHRH